MANSHVVESSQSRISISAEAVARAAGGELDIVSLTAADGAGRWRADRVGEHLPADGGADSRNESIYAEADVLNAAINDTGSRLGRAWRARNYDEREFPSLAESALRELAQSNINVEALVQWLMRVQQYPMGGPNEGGGFGEPAVTLYNDPGKGNGIVLEALVWRNGTTSIHDHAFPGAFMVAQGSSIHSQYNFSSTDKVRDDLHLGRLRWESSELLTVGAVRKIEPGANFIHSLFHLDFPSLTLVARCSSGSTMQYDYAVPGVAINPFHKPAPLDTQIEMLRALTDPESFQNASELLLRDADLWTILKVLKFVYRRRSAIPDWGRLVSVAAEGQGNDRMATILEYVAEETRSEAIMALRAVVRKKELRFFLALLVNVPSQASITEIVSLRYPGIEPVEKIIAWIGELSAGHDIGLTFTPLTLLLVRIAMDGGSLQDACTILGRSFSTSNVELHRNALAELWQEIHETTLLRPLFNNSQ